MDHGSLVRTCGTIGLWTALFPISADVLSWFLAENYSPVRQTISALAVGPSSWLIDLGLLSFALACLAVGIGMLSLRLPGTAWKVASSGFIGAGLAVAVVAFVNEYAGQRNAGGNIHMWMIFLLYGLFAAAALAAVPGLRDLDEGSAAFSRRIGWAWIVLAPVYYVWFPQGWAGAFERALVLLMIALLVLVARQLQQEGRQLVNTV